MNSSNSQEGIGQYIQRQLQWRYAAKIFDKTRSIAQVDWNVLADSLRLAPSSFGLQPWHFVVVQSSDLRQKLAEAAPMNRQKFETASHIVILARLKTIKVEYIDSFIKHIAETREVPPSALEEYRNMIVDVTQAMSDQDQVQWITRQTYIALGNLLTTAALIGIDTCAMEGIDPIKFDGILDLSKTDYVTVVAAALGYRSTQDEMQFAKKVRFPSEQIFTMA